MAISPGANAKSLCVPTYTWFDRIEKWVKTPIDNYISQLFWGFENL